MNTNIQKSILIPNLVDIGYIVELSGFTKAHIYNEIAANKLPKPIKFGRRSRWRAANKLPKPIKFGRRSRWRAEDVANWINSYIEQGAN